MSIKNVLLRFGFSGREISLNEGLFESDEKLFVMVKFLFA